MGTSTHPLIICGATATGKSQYAFKLAKDYKKEVIILSVDSRQMYKDLPLVTGQDNLQDIPSNVNLYGQSILNPNQSSNIGDFQKYSESIIEKSIQENKKLIIVGGSGLYLKAITQNLGYTKVPPDKAFRKEAEKLNLTELQNLLKELNVDLFNSLNNSDANNPRRLIRHIEITRSMPSSDNSNLRPAHPAGGSDISYSWLGLRKSPNSLLESINKRVISRLEAGAIDEVKSLLKKFPNKSLPIYTTLGVKEIIKYLNKELSKEDLVKIWTIADNNYAKRQIVWFKKQPGIVWYDSDI